MVQQYHLAPEYGEVEEEDQLAEIGYLSRCLLGILDDSQSDTMAGVEGALAMVIRGVYARTRLLTLKSPVLYLIIQRDGLSLYTLQPQ